MRDDTIDGCDDRVCLQTLVALDRGKRFAATNRISHSLLHAMDDAGVSRRDLQYALGIGSDDAVQRKMLAKVCRPGLSHLDAGPLDLLRHQFDVSALRVSLSLVFGVLRL